MTDEEEEAARREELLAASRALPSARRIALARDILNRANQLRDEVREDLHLKRWGADDVQMDEYNDFASRLAWLFPDDPVLGGGLIRMPDAILQSYGTLWPIESLRNDLPALRLQARLGRLINRLEMVLGVPVGEGPSQPHAGDTERRMPVRPRIFISHSGESPAFYRLVFFLWDLDVEPVVAEWQPFQGQQVPQNVRSAMDSCVAAIVFATAADQVGDRKQPGRGALIETGILQERFGKRVIYLVEKEVELGPMADNFACEFFTQDNLEAAQRRVIIELRAFGLI